MKKTFLIAAGIGVSALSFGQNASKAKPVAKPPVKAAAPTPALKTLNDSASYAIGVSVASFYKQQGFTAINTALLSKAINEVLAGKQTLIAEAQCNAVMNQVMRQVLEDKSKPNIEEGNAFLAKNKLRPEVKITATGLQYEIIKEGSGPKPLAVDSVTVHYKGTLLDGNEFDNSYARGEPATFALNRVIAGWTEGLQLMTAGSKYKFYIPYNLAYGSMGNGRIPGGAMLSFEVELLDVKKTQ